MKVTTLRFINILLLLAIIPTISCQHTYEKVEKLYYAENTRYIFKMNKGNNLSYNRPSFSFNRSKFLECDKNDGVYTGFDKFSEKEFKVSFVSEIDGVSQLKQLMVSDSLIGEFGSSWYQSTNHEDYDSIPMFFFVDMNGAIEFSLDDNFDGPTTTSMTFLPKYDREFEVLFYENDVHTRFFVSNTSNKNQLKIMISREFTSDVFFRVYDFEPVKR